MSPLWLLAMDEQVFVPPRDTLFNALSFSHWTLVPG